MNRIALVEVWLGKIPDYFKFHLESIKYVTSIDFYFFTNDTDFKIEIENKNFNFFHITESEFLDRFNKTSPLKFDKILNKRKIIDFKLSYFEMFNDILKNYDYIGIYDIDT